MKVIIIEDEAPAARRLNKLLSEQVVNIEVVKVIDSVSESVEWFNSNNDVDIAFMDIQLSDGLSFDIFEKTKVNCPVIFTTAYDDYAIKAFKVNSIDYLLKPIDIEELKSSIDKFNSLNSNQGDINIDFLEVLKEMKQGNAQYKSRFLVKLGQKFIPVSVSDIVYFYAENKAVYLVTNNGNRYVLDQSLDQLEKELNPQRFFRANRQFILAEDAIESVHTTLGSKLKVYVQPETEGQVVLVSKEKAASFKNWLNK